MLLLFSLFIGSHFDLWPFILNVLLLKLKRVTLFLFLFLFQLICELKFVLLVLVFVLSFFFSLYHVMILELIFMHSVLHEELLHRYIVLMRTVKEHFLVFYNWLIGHFWLFSHVLYYNFPFQSFDQLMVQKSKDLLFCLKILMNRQDLRFWGLGSSDKKTFEFLRKRMS